MTINREESIDLRERERNINTVIVEKMVTITWDGGEAWLDFKSGLLRRLVALQSEHVMT